MSGRGYGREAERCSGCGRDEGALREGLCLNCWYSSPDRPKPIRDRYAKLTRLREIGIEPFAYSFEPSHSLADARRAYEEAEQGEALEELAPVRVSGRILSFRDLGGSAFAHLGDREGRLQVHFRRDVLGAVGVELLGLLDLGDWIGVEGRLFCTRSGEVTVRAEGVTLLSKSLRPLPFGKEEVDQAGKRIVHGGFSNVEARYRQRYADLAVNPDIRRLFETRSRVVSSLRSFLDTRGFLEVETPVLQPLYGGAFAQPFTTHHNALDRTLYLRVADELYLKRLIVGNLERVYEIGKDFRNEGIDRTHNPEFTMLELYAAFADYEAMMSLSEQMVAHVVEEVCGRTVLEYEGSRLDFSAPWARLSYVTALREHAGVDPTTASDATLRERVRETGRADGEELPRTRLLDALFSSLVEPELTSPTIVFDFPVEMSPLAKPKRGNPALAERFEVVVAGSELINAFSELNDPLDQWTRFAAQSRQRAAGDLEAQPLDEDYIRALEYGLPPTGGLGLGVDRLVMLVTGQTAIREVILYPILRSEEGL